MPPPSIPSLTAASSRPAPSPLLADRRPGPSADSAASEDIRYTLEALHNLITHCPDWAKRLDELSDQIGQRQVDLALFAEQNAPLKRKSLRNRGSTESLKPKDDGEAHPGASGRMSAEETLAVQRDDAKRTSGLTNATTQRDPSGADEANSPTSSAVERQTPQVRVAATAEARAALRRSQLGKKRPAADSLASGDGPAVASKYHSKSLVIVYYDSYVQSFFEEVVKFVSASRSLMRKAKMAAKVAQIKRMAELEMPDDDSSNESEEGLGNGTARFLPPQLSPPAMLDDGMARPNGGQLNHGNLMSVEPAAENGNVTELPSPAASGPLQIPLSPLDGNSMLRPRTKLPGLLRPSMTSRSSMSPYSNTKQQPGILDELDKSLEFVQSMCEQAAHQFLRDGDCSDDIVKIQGRLAATKAVADEQLQKIMKSDTGGNMHKLLTEGGPMLNRPYRSQYPRRDIGGGGPSPTLKTSPISFDRCTNGFTSGQMTEGINFGAGPALEVDDDIDERGVDARKEPPKFEFRSTRTMGPRVVKGL